MAVHDSVLLVSLMPVQKTASLMSAGILKLEREIKNTNRERMIVNSFSSSENSAKYQAVESKFFACRAITLPQSYLKSYFR